jgi:hypothetical protein
MQWTDGTAYFGRSVSYICNMFMKYTTGIRGTKTPQGTNVIKLFAAVIYQF